MEAMEELSQLSKSMCQVALLLAAADPSDDATPRRPSTFLNAVALGNVVSIGRRSCSDLIRSDLFVQGAGKTAMLNSLFGHPVLVGFFRAAQLSLPPFFLLGDLYFTRVEEVDGVRMVYLDHAGATLYSEAQMADVVKDLTSSVYGNPHSQSDSSNCHKRPRYCCTPSGPKIL